MVAVNELIQIYINLLVNYLSAVDYFNVIKVQYIF
jgi:hypothetical protein